MKEPGFYEWKVFLQTNLCFKIEVLVQMHKTHEEAQLL